MDKKEKAQLKAAAIEWKVTTGGCPNCPTYSTCTGLCALAEAYADMDKVPREEKSRMEFVDPHVLYEMRDTSDPEFKSLLIAGVPFGDLTGLELGPAEWELIEEMPGLTTTQKDYLNLYYFQNLSTETIGKMRMVQRQTVEGLISIAKKHVIRQLQCPQLSLFEFGREGVNELLAAEAVGKPEKQVRRTL